MLDVLVAADALFRDLLQSEELPAVVLVLDERNLAEGAFAEQVYRSQIAELELGYFLLLLLLEEG